MPGRGEPRVPRPAVPAPAFEQDLEVHVPWHGQAFTLAANADLHQVHAAVAKRRVGAERPAGRRGAHGQTAGPLPPHGPAPFAAGTPAAAPGEAAAVHQIVVAVVVTELLGCER